MKHNIYLDSGFLDIPKILTFGTAFNIIIGGRGTGKTFGALMYALENKIKFILVRRTQTQIDIITRPDFNPFKALGANVGVGPLAKNLYGFYQQGINGDGEFVNEGAPIGFAAALSTFSSIRGFDASDIDLIIFDEFIPELHEKKLKHEDDAFFNMYETVNRNREIIGKPPVVVLLLANSNQIANPLMMNLELVRKAMDMMDKKQEVSIMHDKCLSLIIVQNSKISEEKSETVLYRLTRGSKFQEMALSNEFAFDVPDNVISRNLKNYNPYIKVGEISIYKHKSDSTYYISKHSGGGFKEELSSSDVDLERLRKNYMHIYRGWISKRVEFEDYVCQKLFETYFHK